MHEHAWRHMPEHTCEDQRTTCRRQFSLSLWSPCGCGLKLMAIVLVTSAPTSRAASLLVNRKSAHYHSDESMLSQIHKPVTFATTVTYCALCITVQLCFYRTCIAHKREHNPWGYNTAVVATSVGDGDFGFVMPSLNYHCIRGLWRTEISSCS